MVDCLLTDYSPKTDFSSLPHGSPRHGNLMKANKDESASRTEVTVLCRLRHGSAISSFCCVLSVRSKSEASPHSEEGIAQGHEYQKAGIIGQVLESLPQCSAEREKRRSWIKEAVLPTG